MTEVDAMTLAGKIISTSSVSQADGLDFARCKGSDGSRREWMCSVLILLIILLNLVLSDLLGSLLKEGLSNSTVLWKSDEWLLASLSDDEDVGKTGGEGVSLAVLDLDDLVRTWMVLNGHEGTDTTNIVSCLDEDLGTVLEFNNSINSSSLEVELL